MLSTLLFFAVATQWNPEDIVSQYNQNAMQAQTLRIQWKQTSVEDANTARRWREYSKSVHEKEASSPKFSLAQRDVARMNIESLKQEEKTAMSLPPAMHYQGDFWSDRVHFQLRCPTNQLTGGPFFYGNKLDLFKMPDADISAETLVSEFGEIWITAWGPATKRLFRVWDGRRTKSVWSGVVSLKCPTSVIFPPFAAPLAEWGGTSSLIDEFFGPDPVRTRILGETEIDDVNTVVLERVWIQGNTTRALIGYIDVERGSIPLRIEVYPIGGEVSPDHKWPIPRVSKRLDGEQLALKILRGVVIAKHDGVYYPMRGLVEHLIPIGHSTGDDIAVRGTESWEVHSVEWNRSMPEEMFALQFPPNTVFVDQTKNENRLTGDVDGYAKRVIGGFLPKQKPASRAWLWWTLSVAGCAILLGGWRWRRAAT